MKRIRHFKIFLAIAVVSMVAFSSLNVNAAGPSYTAAYGTPTIDGVVNSGEYGPAVPFNRSNLSLFYYNLADKDPTTENANFPDATYAFAWDEGHLYVGITASNIENITDAQFQIDLSPNKKIKDGKAGIFYTFKCIVVGEDGLMGISRANFSAGSIAKSCKSASREVSSGVYNLEIAIPLSELQVTGNGGNFTSLELKSGEWGIGCYMVGNGGGYTSTLGAGNNDGVGYNWENGEGSLVQYYNTLTLASKPSVETPGGDTNPGSSQNPNNPSNPGSTTPSGTTAGGQETPGNGDPDTTTPGGDTTAPGDTNSDDPTGTNNGTDSNGDKTTTPGGEDKKNPDKDGQTGGDKNDKNKTDIKKSDPNKTILVVCAVLAGVMMLGAGVAAFFILKKKPEAAAYDDRRDSDENK